MLHFEGIKMIIHICFLLWSGPEARQSSYQNIQDVKHQMYRDTLKSLYECPVRSQRYLHHLSLTLIV